MMFGRILPRLLLGFLLLSPLPLAGLAWLFIQAFEYTLGETVQTSLSAIADKKADQIGAYLDERLADSRLLARSSATLEALRTLSAARPVERAQRYSGYFRALRENIGYYDLLLANADGDVAFSIEQAAYPGGNLNSGPYRDSALARAHREALALLDTQTVLDLRYAPSGGRPAMFVVTPVLDGGAVAGTVALQLDLDKLTAVTGDNTGLGESGETVLAQREIGDVLYVGPLRRIADAAFRYRVPQESVAKPMRAALGGENGRGITRDYVGVDVVAAWRYLPALRWGMVVKMDTAEAFAPAQRLRVFTWGAFTLLLLCASVAAIFYGRALAEPIRQLMAATRRIAEGDLKRRAPELGWQELRELAASFNQMADRASADQAMLERRVDERVCDLRRSAARYDALVASISAGVYTLEKSAGSISNPNRRCWITATACGTAWWSTSPNASGWRQPSGRPTNVSAPRSRRPPSAWRW